MAWEPTSPDEPFMVPLTDKMLARRGDRDGLTPEELLVAKEQTDEAMAPRRKLSAEMRRALLWLSSEEPARIHRLIAWALPIAEAYLVRRYLLAGDRQADIARDVGVTRAGVAYRLRRALWRLRAVQDVAWDLSERELRAAVGDVLPEADAELLVVFWAHRFSQSRTAEKLERWPQHVQSAIPRIADALAPAASRRRDTRRVRQTLLEVQRRKLWTVSPPLACHVSKGVKRELRLPGGAR